MSTTEETSTFHTTATAILSRAAVLRKDDEEDLRRAIVEALEKTRREALEEAAQKMCHGCACGWPVDEFKMHRTPEGWTAQCDCVGIWRLMETTP